MDPATPPEPPSARRIFLALAGIVLLGLIVAIALPAQYDDHRHRSGSVAIAALKTIGSAQTMFRERGAEGDGNFDYGTLAELSSASLIDPVLGSGTKQGYLFATGPGTGAPEFVWWATANPAPETRSTDPRTFFANHEGLIWYTTSGQAAPITSLARAPAGWKRIGE